MRSLVFILVYDLLCFGLAIVHPKGERRWADRGCCPIRQPFKSGPFNVRDLGVLHEDRAIGPFLAKLRHHCLPFLMSASVDGVVGWHISEQGTKAQLKRASKVLIVGWLALAGLRRSLL